MGSWSRSLATCLALVFLSGAGCRDTVVETGLTGIDLTVQYGSGLELDQLYISGTLDGEPAFEPGTIPETARSLSDTEESLVILLPDDMGGMMITLRVDGLSGGEVKASEQADVAIQARKLVEVTINLGDPAECGDGVIRPGLEECDDGNDLDGDGCGSSCLIEEDWQCSGVPSDCWNCGDGSCDTGENYCNCPVDCPDVCPDECCSASEDTCSCSNDCGAETCGNGNCCAAQSEDTCSCSNDCGAETCGNGNCCAAQSEDTCTCPGDCGSFCGDGCVNGSEQCDDGNTSSDDGCSSGCNIEPGWTCNGEPSCCEYCGNDVAECTEACDGGDLNGETCLSQGYLLGGGSGIECNSGCDGFLTLGGRCAGRSINSESDIDAAIAEAYATDGHEVISIWDGNYDLQDCFVLDECGGGPCTPPLPYGITFKPRSGEVILINDSCAGPIFEVHTGNNVFDNLQFKDTDFAIDLLPGADAGNNELKNLYFDNSNAPGEIIRVGSDGNVIEANRFRNDSGDLGTSAISVYGENNVVSMNVIYGAFASAILLDGADSDGGITFVDHNSIWLRDQAGSTGVTFNNASGVCYRNNIVYGDNDSTGLYLSAVGFATGAECGGTSTQNNVNLNHATECADAAGECAAFCTGGGILYDRSDDPDFQNNQLCLSVLSGLVDTGIDVGYDMWDDSPDDYNGAAPEVGARESGVSRYYGGVISSCP